MISVQENVNNEPDTRLDAYGVGSVTTSNLSGFDEFDAYYIAPGNDFELQTPIAPKADIGTQLRVPILVWIDDNPINNVMEVAFARRWG